MWKSLCYFWQFVYFSVSANRLPFWRCRRIRCSSFRYRLIENYESHLKSLNGKMVFGDTEWTNVNVGKNGKMKMFQWYRIRCVDDKSCATSLLEPRLKYKQRKCKCEKITSFVIDTLNDNVQSFVERWKKNPQFNHISWFLLFEIKLRSFKKCIELLKSIEKNNIGWLALSSADWLWLLSFTFHWIWLKCAPQIFPLFHFRRRRKASAQ